ncbi:MAG: DUF2812 domain-containing protein [Eubacteriales bacterium]|nr:DUF2812 domain-containing protein [Eubacteriales bacterium]
MKQVIHKCFLPFDFEKEEKWLNQKSEQGLQLLKVGACKYTFEQGNASEYQYCLVLKETMPGPETSKEYLHFLKERKMEYVGSFYRWDYLRKKTNLGEFDLNNAPELRADHLLRILRVLLCLIPICLWAVFKNLHYGAPINDICAIVAAVLVLAMSFASFKLRKKWKELSN